VPQKLLISIHTWNASARFPLAVTSPMAPSRETERS
jgi:hypothetical protein